MKSNVKTVTVIYPEDITDLQRKQAKSIAKILIDKLSDEELELLIKKLT